MASVRSLARGEFYGEIVRRHVSCGATLSIVRHDDKNDLPEHTHAQPYFCMLVEGAYTEVYHGQPIHYEPFSVALHPAGFSHSDSIPSAGASFFTIELGDEWHERLHDRVDLHNVKVRLAGADVSWSALRLLRESKRCFMTCWRSSAPSHRWQSVRFGLTTRSRLSKQTYPSITR